MKKFNIINTDPDYLSNRVYDDIKEHLRNCSSDAEKLVYLTDIQINFENCYLLTKNPYLKKVIKFIVNEMRRVKIIKKINNQKIVHCASNHLEHDKSNLKIFSITKNGNVADLIRVFEFSIKADIIESNISIPQITDLFDEEGKQKISNSYYSYRNKLSQPAAAQSRSPTFYNFTLLCAKNLTKSQRNTLINEIDSIE